MPIRPRSGRDLQAAPEVVVVELLRRGRLERVHLAALRIDAGHHVLDRAVLAGGVHRLEDQQDRPAVLGVQALLQLREHLGPLGERLLGLRLVLGGQLARVVGVDVLQAELLAVGEAIGRGKRPAPLDPLRQAALCELHRSSSRAGRLARRPPGVARAQITPTQNCAALSVFPERARCCRCLHGRTGVWSNRWRAGGESRRHGSEPLRQSARDPRAAGDRAQRPELADRGAAAHADEQPRCRGRREPAGAGGLRRHRPRGARLALLRRAGRDPAAPRRRRDAAGPVRQAGRRVQDPCRRAARADRQLQPGGALGDLGRVPRARSPGPDDVRPDDRGLVDLHRQPGDHPGHLRDLRRGRAPAL